MKKHNHHVISIDNIDDDEILLSTIYKHIFGIAIVYAQAIFGIITSIALAYFLLPEVLSNNDAAFRIATFFAFFAVVFAVVIMSVATIIYRQSHIIITDKNITQVLQGGLFERKVSQLSMANVEDVTSDQKGFFASIFDFGVLKIETAGEQANFHFNYCPRPSYYAKIILEAREKFTAQDYPYAAAVKGQMQYHTQAPQPTAPNEQQQG